jgi:predicted Ser/Thr protein kinase
MDTPRPDQLFLEFQQALAGRYSIDRELGRGGMGIVYLAREVHLDRMVAIKLLPPARAEDPQVRSGFLREARLAAKLSHPNIIPIHAVEDREGFVFYVMAFVDGETLTERVRTRGPLTGSEGARVLREAAWALAYAHAQDLVHRDVKPDNILLEGATQRVLIADFGIAAAASDGGGAISGTPEFMSPEQVLGGRIDGRSDLYGLGATAYFALSGRLPFDGENATEILARQVTELPPPLGTLGLAIPRKVAALVDRCLAKEPDHRPESAQAFADQLGLALEQRREAPLALRTFVKRSGRLDGGGTLIVGLLLIPIATGVAAVVGTAAGWAALLAGATVLPYGYLLAAARRLRLQGFAHEDLEPVFSTEIENNREELALGHKVTPSVVERLLGFTALAGASIAALSIAGIVAFGTMTARSGALFGAVLETLAITFVFSVATATFTGIGHLALRQQRTDVESVFWSKVWLGKLGRGIFKLAGRMLRGRTLASAMTHRATELSLGMAAEQLFQALPKKVRADLKELPELLQRLQSDAQALRKRYDGIQEALADIGDAATSAAYADLRAARDAVHAKLGEAVGALETIRLDLLRLHAGGTTVAGVTTHLDLAADVSAEVARLVAAQGEVEKFLARTTGP